MEDIKIKRIYDVSSDDNGYRILIDRIWPRGVSKEEAKLDDWMKEISPSDELRKWFGHDPDKFGEFAKKYRKELDGKKEDLTKICKKAKDQTVILLYGAKDTEHNHAIVLREVIEASAKL